MWFVTASPGTTSNTAYSVQAQAVLAECLASLLDVSYGSQEKERVATLLINLMYNVTPYLKNHTYEKTLIEKLILFKLEMTNWFLINIVFIAGQKI